MREAIQIRTCTAGPKIVSAWPWHLEMAGPMSEHRDHVTILWAVSAKVIAVFSRWLGAVAVITAIARRAATLSSRRLRTAWPSSASWLPPVGQQFVEPAVQLRRHPREDVLEVGHGSCPMSLADCSRLMTTARVRRPTDFQ